MRHKQEVQSLPVSEAREHLRDAEVAAHAHLLTVLLLQHSQLEAVGVRVGDRARRARQVGLYSTTSLVSLRFSADIRLRSQTLRLPATSAWHRVAGQPPLHRSRRASVVRLHGTKSSCSSGCASPQTLRVCSTSA
jgi:hypothetical protein